MKNWYKYFTFFTFGMGILTIVGFFSMLIIFEQLRPLVENFAPIGEREKLGYIVGICLLLGMVYHGLAVLHLFLQFGTGKDALLLRSALLFIGLISTIMLFGNLTLISDIGNQYKVGMEQGTEWAILSFNQGLHLLFVISMTLLLLRLIIRRQNVIDEDTLLMHDSVFTSALYIGILCGISGIVSVIAYFSLDVSFWVLKTMSTKFTFIFLCPYLLICIFWILLKLGDKGVSFYDEKKFRDIVRAATITISASFVILTVWYIVGLNDGGDLYGLLWYPLYIFSALFLFSSSALIFNKLP